MEDRALLSGFHHGFGGVLANPSPAVQADLTKIQQDVQTLKTDRMSLASTLEADQQAIQTAITNSTTVQAAKTTLSADRTKWLTTLQTDWKAIASATGAARQTAINQLESDWTAASMALKADRQAISSAIMNDPAIQTAKSKFTTDSKLLLDDQAALKADQLQLQKDLQAQAGSTNTYSSTSSTLGYGYHRRFGF
jgi:hypothetical protein